jgi:hypothetical protein
MPLNVNILARTMGQLETDTLRLVWLTLSDDDLLSDGSPADPAFMQRYTKSQVDDAINQAYANIVVAAKHKRSWLVIRMKQYYGQYPLPLQVAGFESVYYFSSASSYEELEYLDRGDLEARSPGWITDLGDPEYVYPGDPIGMYQTLAVVPRPLVNGTAVIVDSAVSNTIGAYGPVEGIEGTAGTGSATGTYVDSQGQNFDTLGVVVGQTIVNRSDESKGTITSITTTNTTNDTIVCSGGLTGGAINAWSIADEMQITGGVYYPVTILSGFASQYYLSPNMGQLPLPGLTMAAGNILASCFMYPMLLREHNQYPELPPQYHQAIPYGAASILFSQQPAGSPEAAKGVEYAQTFAQKVAEAAASKGAAPTLRLIGDSNRSRRWP